MLTVTDSFLTVEEFATKYRKHPVTVRRNAKKWGGFKLPGSSEWLMPHHMPTIDAGLTPPRDNGGTKCRTNAKVQISGGSELEELERVLGLLTTKKPKSLSST